MKTSGSAAGPPEEALGVSPASDPAAPTAAPTAAEPPAAASRRRWPGRVLRYGFLVLVVVFAVIAIRDQYSAVSAGISKISVASIAGALAVVAGSLWLSMLSWRRVLADLGSSLPLPAAARVFFIGQLGKYLPGSVWPVLAQMELARDHNVPRTRTAAAALVALGLGLVGSLLVAGVLLPFAVTSTGWRLLLLAGLLISLLIASPAVLNRVLAGGLRVLRRPGLDRPLSARGLAVATAYSASSWIMQGLALYFLAASIGHGIKLLPLSVGSYAAASALGIVILIAPAGLGVREPAIVAALAGELGAGGALVAALVIRLVVTIADVAAGGILAALPASRMARRHRSALPRR